MLLMSNSNKGNHLLYIREVPFFEPRDETGIAASCLFKKFILENGFFFDCNTIRELFDVSTVSINNSC